MLQDYHIFYILKNHVPRVTACLKIKAMAQEAQRATSHTSQDRDHEIERAKRKRLKAISTHLQHHVVWSLILKCSVKSYVTGSSTKR